jgi:uncharacterized protein YndB with AHSA1/START domain
VPSPFRFDREFELDASPDRLWAVLERTDEYPSWWSWLKTLEDGDLRQGAVAHCVVRAPLPYTLRFDVAVERVVPHELISTMVRGDLEGPARLDIQARSGGCTARLSWVLELRDTLLRPLSMFARPAMVWAHDRVIETGLRDFERRALDGQAKQP